MCISIIAALPTILLNALVIFAVATRRRLQNNSTILLACLAGADFLIGLLALPFAFLLGLKQLLGVGPFCPLQKAFIVITTMGINASCSHLAVISMDRLYSYKIPLEVSGYCHRNADNNKCCSRLGFHVTGDNQ